MKITVSEPLSQKEPRISWFNDSFYIGWSTWDQIGSNYYYHVYGQRIQNNNKLWGDNGVMVSALSETELNNECTLTGLVDDMYVWDRVQPSGARTIWVKRMARWQHSRWLGKCWFANYKSHRLESAASPSCRTYS